MAAEAGASSEWSEWVAIPAKKACARFPAKREEADNAAGNTAAEPNCASRRG